MPLTPTLILSCPLQICALYIFTLDSVDNLILVDFYCMVCNLPAGQSNSAKVIQILGEWFCDHGMPEVLYTDNGPQYASAAFGDCSIEWDFTSETSSPHYPQSNGFAESCVKIIIHMLQCAKYSGTNPGIALQHFKAPKLMLNFPHPLRCCTTKIYIPLYHLGSSIQTQQTSQVQEHLEVCGEQANSYR